MKSIKDIEKMSLEELLEAASDETVQVPEGFADGLEAMRKINALTEDEDSSSIHAASSESAPAKAGPFRRRMVRFISAVAAIALIAGIGFSLVENEPEDTFDDPRLAYAELEKAFATISDGISRGIAMAEDSGQIIEKTSKVFE